MLHRFDLSTSSFHWHSVESNAPINAPPMALRDVLSQDQAVGVLARGWANDKLHHAWLLTGPSGVGKTLLAREMARLLVCESPTADSDACGKCKPCCMVDAGGHPDVLTIELIAGKSRIAVEQIRKIRATLEYPPYGHRSRAVLFEKAELMTTGAQNALLKTLEEPTARTHLFLTTSNPSRLLPTIASRCSRLELSPLPPATLEGLVKNANPDLDDVTRSLATRLSSGSVTVALELADSDLLELTADIAAIDVALANSDIPRLTMLAEGLARDKSRVLIALDLLALWYRDVMYRAAAGSDQTVAFSTELERIDTQAKSLGVHRAGDRIAAALETSGAISQRNANARLAIDAMFLRMLS